MKAGPQRLRGIVKRFDTEKSFGFIGVKGGRDVFFHISAAGDSDTANFFPGERVVFERGEDKRGRVCATYVRLAE
ncbi:hypothetical protein VK70_14565 [Paenibacillus durus ATCC 35681]|uniref:CSD domain-containing protein n=1 Tax=Paenibacillus durus ATCC 35681 TaxID=1333534 RepID=A0A0F7FGI7_PAEDU|nr:hypothetical protein VK70_14565 [Paenibacillus durus ATCC 35681]